MRVSKEQITNGMVEYIQTEVLPKMGDDRALKILFSVGMHAIKTNPAIIKKWLDNDIIKALLDDDGTGHYDIDQLMGWLQESVKEYGSFPVTVPPIPLLSPREITMQLGPTDIASIHQQIVTAAG